MMKITGLSHLFKWENLLNWWLTKYFFAPLYILETYGIYFILVQNILNHNKTYFVNFLLINKNIEWYK